MWRRHVRLRVDPMTSTHLPHESEPSPPCCRASVSVPEANVVDAGEPKPFEALIAERPAFEAFVRKRIHGDDAEEIVQAAFVRAFEHRDELRDRDDARAWFYGILRHALVDRARRSEVRERASSRLAAESDVVVPFEEPRRACACVARVLEDLRPEYREALEHVVLAERPLAELAEGVSPNTAAVRVHRAKKALAREVSATCGACAGDGCRDCTCHA